MIDKHLLIIGLLIILIGLVVGCVAYFSAGETSVAVDLTEINQGDNLTISLTDSKGQPIANKTVHVTVNSVTYNLTTDGSGRTQLPIGLEPGEYNVNVQFDGEFSKYKSSEITQPLKVVVPVVESSSTSTSSSSSSSDSSDGYEIVERDDHYGAVSGDRLSIITYANGETWWYDWDTGDAEWLNPPG